ncbi:MAG: hypothetical protein K6U80_02680 [Firmicutes bacterium]|nr:hypothetical protein [Bacillota bacterium]
MKISSISYYLPEHEVTNDELLRLIIANSKTAVDVDALKKKLLLNKAKTRYFKAPDETSLDMAETAVKRCLEKADLKAEEVDLLLFTSMERMYIEPPMSVLLQNRLRTKANAFDVTNACLGFLNAMELANLYIEAQKYRNILIVSAEIGSQWIPWDKFSIDKELTGFSALTVSDAAVAMLLQPGGAEQNFKIFDFKTFGEYNDLCQIKVGKDQDSLKLLVKSKKLAMVAIELMSDFIPQFLHKSQEYLGTLDMWFLHQVTGDPKKFCGALEDELYNLSYHTFSEVGNTGSASIPLGMALAEEKNLLKRGDKIALIVGASGFSYGGTCFIY